MSERLFNIPESVAVKHKGLAEGIKQLMERQELEKEDLSTQELELDGSNKVSFPGFPYLFEAMNKKIIVSIDIFKSGYECKICKGRKRIESKCECELNDRAGLLYSADAIQTMHEALGQGVAESRAAMACPKCKGDYVAARHIETCTACSGRGAVLILPETSKNLPTTGVVVSIGPCVKMLPEGKKTKYGYGIGDRVLFGAYSGSMIPTKAGLLFKILDASAPMACIEGADDMGAFDFIINEGSE